MRPFHSHIRMLALSTLLAAAPLGFAQAQTPQAAVERLRALMSDAGVQLEWTGAEFNASNATLTGVSVGGAAGTAPIGDIFLQAISEVADGFRVESITVGDYEMDKDGASLSIDGIALGGVLLPHEGRQDAFGGFMFYENASIDSMRVAVAGTEVFTMADMHFEMTAPDGGSPMTTSGAVESFTIDLSLVEDPSQKAVIQALGYEQLEGYIQMEGSWQPTDGRMEMSQLAISVMDAGTLNLTFDIGGYTTAFIASLRELQKQMADSPDGDNSAQGLAMLGLLQQLTFNSAAIGFEDDSLTDKVLDFVAQSQGVSPADLKNQAKAVLPFVLAQLNNPELTAAATQAVSAFLDDPQSLWVSAAPANPVPFALIAAEAMSAPQGLIKTLGVTITANE